MSGELWSTATILGPIVLILVIGYALWTRRRLTPTEKRDQNDAVQDLYKGGSGGPSAPPADTPPKPQKDG